jgi:hypothetical protein
MGARDQVGATGLGAEQQEIISPHESRLPGVPLTFNQHITGNCECLLLTLLWQNIRCALFTQANTVITNMEGSLLPVLFGLMPVIVICRACSIQAPLSPAAMYSSLHTKTNGSALAIPGLNEGMIHLSRFPLLAYSRFHSLSLLSRIAASLETLFARDLRICPDMRGPILRGVCNFLGAFFQSHGGTGS